MKIVLQWYAADRDQLARYYHVPSSARFARLKRYDLDWAAALDALKPGALNAEARKDRLSFQKDVQANLKRVEADAAASAQIGPLVPFAEDIASMEEARMRMDSMDAEGPRKYGASDEGLLRRLAEGPQKAGFRQAHPARPNRLPFPEEYARIPDPAVRPAAPGVH